MAEQIDSLERKTHRNWNLLVSEDGSQGGTLAILQGYMDSWSPEHLKIVQGAQRGFIKNCLSQLCRTDIDAGYVAWADQYDTWSENKLHAALVWLERIPKHIYALYVFRAKLIDDSSAPISFPPRFCFQLYFANALFQNPNGGNTMVFNLTARGFIQAAGDNIDIPAHNWRAYQLILGPGGAIRYDQVRRVLYRKHVGGLVDSNFNRSARLHRLRMVSIVGFYKWNVQSIHALEVLYQRLSIESLTVLNRFKGAWNKDILQKYLEVRRAVVHRQTFFVNILLSCAILMKSL